MIKLRIALFLLLSCAQAFAQPAGGAAGGELALRALQRAFPGKIDSVAFIDNDWVVTVGGEAFFWAGGRLLPRAEMDKADSYGAYAFYPVPARVAPPDSYPPQYIEALRARGSSEARRERKDNSRAFHAALYGGLERREIEGLLERIDFLGEKVTVHRDIAGPLGRVEAAIRQWEGGRSFIASIRSIEGYSWRQIAGTQRMSYHSWGLAVDIQPRRLGGKAIYWLWEMGRNDDWMLVPLESRWNPPGQVIEAFEKEGFIWGGKWPVYDNMHFEYRPELHELTRLLDASPAASEGSPGRDLHHVYPDTLRN
ncbi:MAG: M15 family metallopeptidase [Treponema sp.]|jgi:hypothetical protein|nr:M15 family metallopeptidase [Treponema sp.]